MTAVDYVIALLRLALLGCPLVVAAHLVRTRFSSLHGAHGVLLESVLALAWLLVAAELLGLVGGLRFGWLVAALWGVACSRCVHGPAGPARRLTPDSPHPQDRRAPPGRSPQR
jgi:hypothetical protein